MNQLQNQPKNTIFSDILFGSLFGFFILLYIINGGNSNQSSPPSTRAQSLSSSVTRVNTVQEPSNVLPSSQSSKPYSIYIPKTNQSGGYIVGTCKQLSQQGLGDFIIGDPNYTRSRDKDGDGVACEL